MVRRCAECLRRQLEDCGLVERSLQVLRLQAGALIGGEEVCSINERDVLAGIIKSFCVQLVDNLNRCIAKSLHVTPP